MKGFVDIIKPYDEDTFLELIKLYGFEGEIFHCYKEEGDLPKKLYLCLAKKVKEITE